VRQVDALGSLSPVIAGLVGDRTDAEVLGLSVRSYGVGAGGLYDTYLEVPWSGVQRVEESRLSWKRTAALAAVGAAIAVGIIQAASGSSGPDDGEGPDEISVPFLRIVWW
jgi:hypothetical protein